MCFLNPMPGDRRESKTWLSEDSGPIDSQHMLMEGAPYFRLDAEEAAAIWTEVAQPVGSWCFVAKGSGMRVLIWLILTRHLNRTSIVQTP